MKWKFWKKEDKKDDDETIIKVSKRIDGTEIYVCAKSKRKALSLYKKLKEEVD